MRSRSRRSARQAARNMGYMSGSRTVSKRVNKPIPTFNEYVLMNGDVMIIGNIEDMLLQFKHRKDGYISNNVFKVIRADKIGLFYCIRRKLFMWLAINDDFTIYILFKDKELRHLPNTIDFNIESPKYQIIENANRLIWSVYNKNDILDLTTNPIIMYKVGEIFKK